MFERFTDRARRVVVLAQEEARLLGHNFIGTEHLLLGLIHEGDGIAARALESMGIELDVVRQRVTEIVGSGTHAESGHIPFTPRAKKVLELSLREAQQLGHDYIGTEHILLGLIREGEGVAAQVLVSLGAGLNRVRARVIGSLTGLPATEERTTARPVPAPASDVSGRRERALLSGIRSRLSDLEARLTLAESRVGTGPDQGALERQVAKIRGDKQAAASVQDYEHAAVLRDKELELLAEQAGRRETWLAENPTLPALAQEVRRLSDEVERLGRQLAGHAASAPASAGTASAGPEQAESPGSTPGGGDATEAGEGVA
jgi:Clp amino terminal domain, pathogenicity island component